VNTNKQIFCQESRRKLVCFWRTEK